MKSILFIGATLMIGATIYGFVDYKKTSHSKEFRNLYEKEKVNDPVVISEKSTNSLANKEAVAKEKATEEKREMDKKEEELNILPSDKKITPSRSHTKKLNYKSFSRAPLDRRYLDKELNTEELRKSEPAKTKQADSLKENQ
ncbi:MAG: hypothetical protein ABUL41_01395 [Chitinophagaceae bacterium]